MSDEVWIGLAEVLAQDARTRNEVLDGAHGAYVQALTLARDESDFRARVGASAAELGLKLEAVEDVEPFARRSARGDVHHLRALVDDALQGGTVCWGTFHAYPETDER